MLKQILIYGFIMAFLLVVLKIFEYTYFIKSFSEEVYVGAIALFFTVLGIWLSFQFIQRKQMQVKSISFNLNSNNQIKLSDREIEVLEGMASGMSNKEIGEKLFLSESTIKSHSTNLYAKLNVNRRTQAIQKAREIGLLS